MCLQPTGGPTLAFLAPHTAHKPCPCVGAVLRPKRGRKWAEDVLRIGVLKRVLLARFVAAGGPSGHLVRPTNSWNDPEGERAVGTGMVYMEAQAAQMAKNTTELAGTRNPQGPKLDQCAKQFPLLQLTTQNS